MEIFVDFGLFEFAAAVGLSDDARKIYANRVLGRAFLLASVVLPAATIGWAAGGRWLGAASLAAALVNASAVAAALQKGNVPGLTFSPAKGDVSTSATS
jgi:hypothetical protein